MVMETSKQYKDNSYINGDFPENLSYNMKSLIHRFFVYIEFVVVFFELENNRHCK